MKTPEERAEMVRQQVISKIHWGARQQEVTDWLQEQHGIVATEAQIPISVAVLAVFCFAISGVIVATGAHPLGYFFTDFVLLFLAHLVPLGLYWWVAQSGPILISLLQRLLSIFRS